jgi:hypothetical protein
MIDRDPAGLLATEGFVQGDLALSAVVCYHHCTTGRNKRSDHDRDDLLADRDLAVKGAKQFLIKGLDQ